MVERMISVFDEEEIQMRTIKSEIEEEREEIAKRMIDRSMPADIIAYLCDLPIERVNALEREA